MGKEKFHHPSLRASANEMTLAYRATKGKKIYHPLLEVPENEMTISL